MQALCLFRLILNKDRNEFASGILIRNKEADLFHVEHELHIALARVPLSQKTTLEMYMQCNMVYRPPSHYVLLFFQIVCSTLFKGMFHVKRMFHNLMFHVEQKLRY